MRQSKARYFISITIILLLLFSIPACAPKQDVAGEKPKDITLVVNASGGAMADAMEAVFVKPFTEQTGIKVVLTSPVDFGKLKAMVESQNLEWDITELGGQDYPAAVKQGLLEPLDFAKIDISGYVEGGAGDYGIGTLYYSSVLGYRTDAFPDGNFPQSMADFWNVEKFPGPRSLRNHPVDNLEWALLVDGVPRDKLYPLDVERAFKKLDEIKPHVTVWWESGAQPAQLLLDNEVVMATAWNGRLFAIHQQGAPVETVWQDGILKLTYFCIPKGATERLDAAYKFLSFLASPQAQAEYAKLIPYSGPNQESFKLLPADLIPHLPTSPQNYPLQIVLDGGWWAENLSAMLERWSQWMLE